MPAVRGRSRHWLGASHGDQFQGPRVVAPLDLANVPRGRAVPHVGLANLPAFRGCNYARIALGCGGRVRPRLEEPGPWVICDLRELRPRLGGGQDRQQRLMDTVVNSNATTMQNKAPSIAAFEQWACSTGGRWPHVRHELESNPVTVARPPSRLPIYGGDPTVGPVAWRWWGWSHRCLASRLRRRKVIEGRLLGDRIFFVPGIRASLCDGGDLRGGRSERGPRASNPPVAARAPPS